MASTKGSMDKTFQANLAEAQTSRQHFHEWMQTGTRFVVLANAGGAVATLSFLGTSMASGVAFKFAILPLFCFVAGVIIAGFVILGQLYVSWSAYLDLEPEVMEIAKKKSWATLAGAWAEPRTGKFLLAAAAFFAVGAIIGIIALLAFEPPAA